LIKDFWKPETLKNFGASNDVKAESDAAKKGKKSEHMTRAAFVMTSYLHLLIFAVVTPFVKAAWIAGDQSMEIGTIWRIRFGTRGVHCAEKNYPQLRKWLQG
jgi:hypothetical protein